MTRKDIPSGEELSALNRAGNSLAELARQFGCSRILIRYRIRTAGFAVVYPPSSKKKILHQNRLPDGEALLAEYKAGGAVIIANRYGVSVDAVFKKLHRQPGFEPERSGMQTGAPRKSLPLPDQLLQEYNDNLEATLKTLAEKYGVSGSTIFNRMAESSLEKRPPQQRRK